MNGATTRTALYGSALLVVVLLTGLLWYLAPLRPSALSLQFAATPQAFGAIVHTWPPEHLERYRLHLLIDGALLLAYGVFGYLFATRQGLMAHWRPRLRTAVAWLLPLAAASDATENALHWWLTEVPRFGVPQVYSAAFAAVALKWALCMAFVLAVVAAAATQPDE